MEQDSDPLFHETDPDPYQNETDPQHCLKDQYALYLCAVSVLEAAIYVVSVIFTIPAEVGAVSLETCVVARDFSLNIH